MPLRYLFSLTDYPREVMVLYAQGFSVTRFLVERKGRGTFMKFIKDGIDSNWDGAAFRHYSCREVDDLEKVWIESLRSSRV